MWTVYSNGTGAFDLMFLWYQMIFKWVLCTATATGFDSLFFKNYSLWYWKDWINKQTSKNGWMDVKVVLMIAYSTYSISTFKWVWRWKLYRQVMDHSRELQADAKRTHSYFLGPTSLNIIM